MGECNSSPISGCTDSQTVLKLQEWTDDLEVILGELVVKKGEIVTGVENCTTNIHNIFTEILEKFDTLIQNSEDCCEALNAALQDIIDELDSKVTPPTPVTTEEPTPTTTEEPTSTTTESTPTTTEETPATTEEPTYEHGLFNYEDDADFLCLEENEMTLYYLGVVQVGTTLYIDSGGTVPFALADYVKRAESVVKFSINGFGVITAELEDQCE